MSILQVADNEYYLTCTYLLKVAEHAGKIFASSEPHEKRLLLKMALQNPKLKGKKVQYTWIKPFDTIAFYAQRQLWLPVCEVLSITEGDTIRTLGISISLPL